MVSIKAERREITGKKIKTLRESGKLPAVVYGIGIGSTPLEVLEGDFGKVFRQAGESSLIELEIGPEKKNVLIHEVVFDPVTDKPTHVDFLEVRMDKLIRAKVALKFMGESPAVKNLGGVLVKVMHEIEVEALPIDLPHEIEIDLTRIGNLGDKFTVSDLKLPSQVKIHAEADEILALVEAPRSEEELKAEETITPSLESIEVLSKKKEKEEVSEDGASPKAKDENQKK